MNMKKDNFHRQEGTAVLNDGTKVALVTYGYESKNKIYSIKMVSNENYMLQVNHSRLPQNTELPYFKGIVAHFNLNIII